MISPEVLLVAVCIAVTIWVGQEAVVGAKKVVHGVKHGIHKIIHPHSDDDDAK